MAAPIYLDYNATAPLRPEAASCIAESLGQTGNPSSVHGFGRDTRRQIEDAREALAALVGTGSSEFIFTSGGTEANALALRGFRDKAVIVSAGEHDSVLQNGAHAELCPLDGEGRLDLLWLEQRLAEGAPPALISVMLANNETGVLQPLDAVVALARSVGAKVHCDAVQALGKLPVDMAALDVDFLSLSGHKLGGPPGIGALVLRAGTGVNPLIYGGGQERGRRSGTENRLGIAGFGAAARGAAQDLAGDECQRLAQLRDTFETCLRNEMPEVHIFGAGAARLPNTSCFGLPNLPAETQVMALDLAGIAVSAGSACSSGKVRPSHVLRAMGLDDDLAGSAIRVSLGWDSKPADLDRLLEAWLAFARRCQSRPKAAPSAA